ncbi:putative disease resistance protein At4g11170 [Arachis stenosperma]|uniref:putative disease resistance protein At4g11170 n=1 Tax=Arachis stenosperma TaxID=217475 RepID=UPI0025AC8ACE|nr:putative disease resistance protein At4g11170 [Arachis stenosperma]
MAYSFSAQVSQVKYAVLVCLLLVSKLVCAAANVNSNGTSCRDASLSRHAPQKKHEVFVNFRGDDIRDGFLSHLVKALSREKIIYFVDDHIETGNEIPDTLLTAIEESFISLVIFSPNYTSSRWCLDELVKILQCKEKDSHIVIPVFYSTVKVSHVRNQSGTFGAPFVEHEKKYTSVRIQSWRSALNKSADLAGFTQKKMTEADLIEKVIKCLLKKLNDRQQVNSKELVGIGKPISLLELILSPTLEDVRVIGIWGMPGMGKTTLALEVFDRLRSKFEGSCFLENVRENSGRKGVHALRNQLFSELLGKQDLKIDGSHGLPHFLQKRLCHMKVIIVLDDVNDFQQVKVLFGKREWFCPGSRIIVTSTDKQVLAKEVDYIYKLEPLQFDEALQLFNLNFFTQKHLESESYALLARVIKYAEGIPFVLDVLGYLLHEKDREVWESLLEKHKIVPIREVHNVMRRSYDELDREEKKIFLYVACFFNGLNLTVGDIQMLLKDHVNSVAAGLERLQDKCLVHISQENIVSIHGIVQITAWEIVRQEYIEDSGKQIQLQGPNEICQSLDDKLSRETIANFRKGTCSPPTDLYLHPGPEYLHNGQRYDDLTNYTPEFSEQLSPETFANFSKGTCSIPTDPNLHTGPESLHNGKRYGDLANYTPEFSLEQVPETLIIPEQDAPPSYPKTSPPAPQIKYDVFISFRGTDIRTGFLSHLTKALFRKQIVSFMDNELEPGDKISQKLLQSIEASLISLVIFSERYAFSRWCLDELAKIMECRTKYGQIVIPVFYKVHPYDVRHQKGTLTNAFHTYEKYIGEENVQRWRSASKELTTLPGFVSSTFRNDDELIEKIIQHVNTRLKRMRQVYSRALVGIGKSIARVEFLLRQEPENVRVIGIWGMGGIGKTTIAEEVYNLLRDEYESVVFLGNVREESLRHGIIYLKSELFSKLLGENLEIYTQNGLPTYVEKRIGHMKVLIVLDDVAESEQLKILVGNPQWFGSGSRIIVTTRDRQVLANYASDNAVYKVEPLDFDEALQLFNLIAFQQNQVEKEYRVLAERVVNYAKGIPLVLKTLGHLLHGKDKRIWERELERLGKIRSKKVFDMMRLSYDDLDRQEKSIFLDIACFFDGIKLEVNYLKTLLKDGEYQVHAALKRLEDLAFITISKEDVVTMQYIIQEMAWEIVHQESIEEPGKHSRLWNPDDIYHVLKYNQGTEAIRSISLNYSETTTQDIQLSPWVFSKMNNLQFLDFYGKHDLIRLPQGLQSLPTGIRYLRWTYYPLKSLPDKFSAKNLVILELPYSQVEELWHGVQNLVALKVLKVPYSSQLKEIPDLSKATNLEVMDLKYCLHLTGMHPSVFSLNKLEILDLSWCTSLTNLQSSTHMISLRYLSLSHCKRLKKFSLTSKNMIELDLRHTSIQELPSSIGYQSELEKLHLANSDIKSLPTSIKHLTSLKYLDVSNCKSLETLPKLPISVETLDADNCTSLKTMLFPIINEQMKENKRRVVFWNCLMLHEQFRNAIALNVHINVVRFAMRHLSVLGQDHVEDSNDHGAHKASYVYPGSTVPEWLEYQTTTDNLTIDLYSTPYAPNSSYVLCFVVPKVPSEGFMLLFSISDNEGESVEVSLDRSPSVISSDHVCLIYDQRCANFLKRKVQTRRMFQINVSAVSISAGLENVTVQLKGFGVHLVNPLEHQIFS